jgi:hypothetical protein
MIPLKSRISQRAICSSVAPDELLRFSEAALAWFSFPLGKNALREILLQIVSAK